MPENDEALTRADGDGPVDADQLAEIRQKILAWNGRATEFYDRRAESESARYCEWAGQSGDGRIWAANNGGVTPVPFDGASDQRIRWADGIVLDKGTVVLTGLAMANISVKASGADAGLLARNLTVLLRWMIDDMGAEWDRQWKILVSHYMGDAPAVAAMAVEWRREERIEYKTVRQDDLLEMYAAARVEGAKAAGVAPTEALGDSVMKMRLLLEEGEGDWAEAVALLKNTFGISEKAAERVLRELIRDGESEFPVTAYGDEGPVIRALRFGEDFVVPDNATGFERCGLWFRTEWMTKTELAAKAREDGWDAEFVEKTIEGGNGLAVMEDALSKCSDKNRRTDLYQVVYVYHEAVNRDGVRAKYVTVIGHGEGTAFGRRLIRGTRGRWPAVFFQREVRSKFLVESRGVPELAGPHQGAAKKLRDTCTDNGIIGGLPPWFAKGTNAQRNKFLGPLAKIDLRINEDIGFMNPPQYPATAQKVYGEIGNEVRDYFGEPRLDGPEQAPGLRRREEAHWFMKQVYDVLRAMVELAQDHASDEWLAAVTDDRQGVAGLRRDGVAGRFRVKVAFNADDLDPEKVIAKAQAVGTTLLAMDRSKRIDTGPVISQTFRSLYPDISEESLISDERAGEREIEEETRNLASIRAGVMPEMDTAGNWNYQGRLAWYEGLSAQNPAVFADLAEDKRAMLEEWLKALAQQAVQFGENRAVGRTGAEGVAG